MKIDMHCHTSEGSSDAHVSVIEYITILKEKGYDGMVITDHDSFGGYRFYNRNRKSLPKDFVVIKGIEYDTLDAGHFLIVMPKGVKLKILEHKGLPIRKLVRLVHEYGGIIGPAHACSEPFLSIFSTGRYRKDRSIAAEFDFIEGYNSGEREADNQAAREVAAKFHKPATGGSDSHKADWVGLGYTLLQEDIHNEDELIAYIKSGKPVECGGVPYMGTLKEKLGKWNNLLVYGFLPYNKLGALLHHKIRKRELMHISREIARRSRDKNKNAYEYVADILVHEQVEKMDEFIQHGRITTLEHCKKVTEASDKLRRKLHIKNVDRRALLRGAMLHDFYLYDWHHEDDGSHKWHGFHHADKARDNAVKYFDVSEKEQEIILSHMWPLNITRLPRSKEAWIVCMADKWISTKETLHRGRNKAEDRVNS